MKMVRYVLLQVVVQDWNITKSRTHAYEHDNDGQEYHHDHEWTQACQTGNS